MKILLCYLLTATAVVGLATGVATGAVLTVDEEENNVIPDNDCLALTVLIKLIKNIFIYFDIYTDKLIQKFDFVQLFDFL